MMTNVVACCCARRVQDSSSMSKSRSLIRMRSIRQNKWQHRDALREQKEGQTEKVGIGKSGQRRRSSKKQTQCCRIAVASSPFAPPPPPPLLPPLFSSTLNNVPLVSQNATVMDTSKTNDARREHEGETTNPARGGDWSSSPVR